MLKIYWFRKDLRLDDNKALSNFTNSISPTDKYVFIYIKNKNTYNFFGQKRISFLYYSLLDLKNQLQKISYKLYVYKGKSLDCFKLFLHSYSRIEVYANRQIEPWAIERDKKISQYLNSRKSVLKLYDDSTLFDPGEILKDDKTPYTVFTPFNNKCQLLLNETHFKKAETNFSKLNPKNNIIPQNCFDFTLQIKNLEQSPIFKGGSQEGKKILFDFSNNHLKKYRENRNYPSVKGTSFISPHLHFGTISIREAYRTALEKLSKSKDKTGIITWINELFWREFYYNITFHFPKICNSSFKEKFDKISWKRNLMQFDKWREGKTGFPIVDAGMRQLKIEGWMHNRLRMITAMFLTKNLLIDWRLGEKHFAENLVDLDFSSNNGGWQWSSSTGCDAQPYFRIFNPYLQSKKFDPQGDYIRKYVEELKYLPDRYIHQPDNMTYSEQQKFGVIIGKDYPNPIVDYNTSKEFAIYQFTKVSKNKY